MARSQISKVDLVRYGILGVIGLIIVFVGGYAVLYALGVVGTDNDTRFVELEEREIRSDPIEVVEFFSYACPHCKTLDPVLDNWRRRQSDDIIFERVHVVFTQNTRVLAQTHLALKQRKVDERFHKRLFDAVARAPSDFDRPETIGDFIDSEDISKEQFQNLYQGDRVKKLVEESEARAREIGLSSVPTILVANKYVIPPKNSPREVIAALNEVIELVRNPPEENLDVQSETEEEVVEP